MDTFNIQEAIFTQLSYDKAIFLLSLGGKVFVFSNHCYWKITGILEYAEHGIILQVERSETELLNFTKTFLDYGKHNTGAEMHRIGRNLVRTTRLFISEDLLAEEKIKLFSSGTFKDLNDCAVKYCKDLLSKSIGNNIEMFLKEKVSKS